jgi:hypothetical protein
MRHGDQDLKKLQKAQHKLRFQKITNSTRKIKRSKEIKWQMLMENAKVDLNSTS